jgi:hypothetical protein
MDGIQCKHVNIDCNALPHKNIKCAMQQREQARGIAQDFLHEAQSTQTLKQPNKISYI